MKISLFVAFTLVCLALSPSAHAVVPAPDGGYPNNNTAEGDFALFSLTNGSGNTAIGFHALFSLTNGFGNTANGANALLSNTIGYGNTANGYNSLFDNTAGNYNTANGFFALTSNTTGYFNTANGANALYNNTTGYYNAANGAYALYSNTMGTQNSAVGVNALLHNATGNYNTAIGTNSLRNNVIGGNNTAVGVNALLNSTGLNNVSLGCNAGQNLTTGAGNVCIGAGVLGVAGESNTTRIRNVYSSIANGRAVYVNSDNKIGTLASTRRVKENIKPMDKASEAVLALKPVSFRYKREIDASGTPQFGLVAEEVADINADLVTRDSEGKPETVRYEAVNAMLLNEFLKEHRKNEQQEATIARQQKQIDALNAGLKEQASQIQKVSAQLEVSKPAPQTALNNQ